MALIEMEHISKRYGAAEGTVHALADVDFRVNTGEMVAILGRSGSGKSTLMNVIGCLDTPTAGDYRLAGRPVAHMTERELTALRRETVGFVFQSFQLMPRESAVENVALPLSYAGVRKKERRDRATKALERVGLGDRVNFRPTQLSGGECQRVAVARSRHRPRDGQPS